MTSASGAAAEGPDDDEAQPTTEERRAVITFEEDGLPRERTGFSCRNGRRHEMLAANGDPIDIELAALHYQRCGEPGAKERAAALWQRLAVLRAGARVSVHFTGYRPGDVYQVQLGNLGCTTPCVMALPPGTATLSATGAGSIEERVVIPERPGQVALLHRDKARLVVGAVLIPAGALLGGLTPAFAHACEDRCQLAQLVAWPIIGFGTFVTGIALVVTSRWMPPLANRVVVGHSRGGFGLTLAGIDAGPLPGGAGAGVRFTF